MKSFYFVINKYIDIIKITDITRLFLQEKRRFMNKKVIVALGGNAIQRGNGATAKEQQDACFETGKQIVRLIEAGYQVIISHGNGPQVGNILLQQSAANSEKLPAMPLDTCVAMTQGMIGYWLQNSLDEILASSKIDKKAVTVITHTLVDQNDLAFHEPTKPVGPFYNAEEAREVHLSFGYAMVEDAGRGYRRVVPSPKPVDIMEKESIKTLVDKGFVVIAGGGGGIPVIKKGNKYVGVEAVIDKDLASEKMAELLDADYFVVLTAVENVAINFGKPEQKNLFKVSASEMKQYAKEGHFAPGSMLPKVEAAIAFVESKPGRISIITSLEEATEALSGFAGTRITQ
ncbi:MAG: arcC [Bacillales bacterium]|jgi:carbamate kinase|nr:arcC [Bacillales bacterium]